MGLITFPHGDSSAWSPSVDSHPENEPVDPAYWQPPAEGSEGWRFGPVASSEDDWAREYASLGATVASTIWKMCRAELIDAVDPGDGLRQLAWAEGYANVSGRVEDFLRRLPSWETKAARQMRVDLRAAYLDGQKTRTASVRVSDLNVSKFPRSLGIQRAKMPQIKSTLVPDFLDELAARGVTVRRLERPVGDLKPTQAEMDLDKVEAMLAGMPETSLAKPVIVSSDDYLLDGHHRWAALYLKSPDSRISTIQVGVKIRELLSLAANFSAVTYKTIDAGISDDQKEVRHLFSALSLHLPGGVWSRVPESPEDLADVSAALVEKLVFEFESETLQKAYEKGYRTRVNNLRKFLGGLAKTRDADEQARLIVAWATKGKSARDKVYEYRDQIIGLLRAADAEVEGSEVIGAWQVRFLSSPDEEWDDDKVEGIREILTRVSRLLGSRGFGKLVGGKVRAYPTLYLPGIYGRSTLACYRISGDNIALALGNRVVDSVANLVHELAHRFWFRVMGGAGRKEWTDFYGANVGAPDVDSFIRDWESFAASATDWEAKKYGRFLSYYLHELWKKDPTRAMWLTMIAEAIHIDEPQNYAGFKRNTVPGLDQLIAKRGEVKVFLHPVTAYSGTSAEELFAEAFSHYLTLGPRRLPDVLRRTLVEAVPQLRMASRRSSRARRR